MPRLLLLALLHAASATLVQELRFVSDAKEMIEKEGGDVVVIGLFGPDQADELKVLTTVAHSREFGATGWVVGWSREERVLRHFEVSVDDTPRVLLYRDFDRVGDILEGGARDVIQYHPEEWKAGGDDTTWDFLSLKRFIWGSSYPPIVRHPIQPDPRDPTFDDEEEDDDDDDETSLADADNEEKLVADIVAMRARRAATSARSQAALQQQTVPKFVVLMHRPKYFEDHTDEGDALLSFSKRQRGRVLVVQMDVEDNPAAEPIAAMLGVTLDEVKAGAGGERPTGAWIGKTGVMPFDGLYVEEAMDWALNDFFEQGAGGSTSEWSEEKRKRPTKKKRKKKQQPDL